MKNMTISAQSYVHFVNFQPSCQLRKGKDYHLTGYREKAETSASAFSLPRRVQHILNKDPISLGGVIDEDVGDGADQFAVLNDR